MNLTYENESVVQTYQRQTELRKIALQSGKFHEYDNNQNDKLLLNIEDAFKVGAISKEFYDKIRGKSKQTEIKTGINFKFGRL